VRKQDPKNVLMNDGSVRRVPGDTAEQLIDSGQAKQFISNTVYRALKLGIEVSDPKTRDEKGTLRAKILAAREKQEKRKTKRKEAEALAESND